MEAIQGRCNGIVEVFRFVVKKIKMGGDGLRTEGSCAEAIERKTEGDWPRMDLQWLNREKWLQVKF